MMTLLKILTFPIWFPFKLLWLVSKLIAFVFLILVASVVIYIAIHIF